MKLLVRLERQHHRVDDDLVGIPRIAVVAFAAPALGRRRDGLAQDRFGFGFGQQRAGIGWRGRCPRRGKQQPAGHRVKQEGRHISLL
jgi:hypothetical protein